MSRDTNRFLELLKPNYNDALKYCRALCSNWSADEAEDVLQQSLLQALENLESLNDEQKFRSWFFKIITRVFYSSVRRHFWKRFLPLESFSYAENIPEVYDRIENNEKRLILNQALSKLSSKERSAILLHEIGEFSIEEIKTIQNERSVSAVKSRLFRARKKLKGYIIEFESRFSGTRRSSQNKLDFTGDLENETLEIITESEARK